MRERGASLVGERLGAAGRRRRGAHLEVTRPGSLVAAGSHWSSVTGASWSSAHDVDDDMPSFDGSPASGVGIR